MLLIMMIVGIVDRNKSVYDHNNIYIQYAYDLTTYLELFSSPEKAGIRILGSWCAWMAQSVKCPTSAQVMSSRFVS